jgi:uncharacterized protein YegL
MCVIVDTSKSVKEFQLIELKDALVQFAGQLEVGPHTNEVLVAAVTFGGEAENPFTFNNHTDQASLAEAMANIQRVAVPRGTRTDLALQECVRLFDTDGRDDAEPVIIVFTDGKVFPRSTDLRPAISAVRARNVTVISVGIGSGIDKDELLTIALNKSKNVFVSDDFSTLANKTAEIVSSSKICLPPVCKKDIIFVLDYSVSISQAEFMKMQAAVAQIVNEFDAVGESAVKVGVVVYGYGAVQEIHLQNTTDKATLLARIDAIKRLKAYRGTRTANALKTAAEMFANEGRPGLDHCIILMTDGRATDPRKLSSALRSLKAGDITILRAVGIGDKINRAELERTAGVSANVIIEPSFDDLDDVVEKIEAAFTCG